MDYLTTVRVLDTDYKLKDEEAARIHHTHKVAEIEDMPDSKALLPTGGGAGQVLAKKSGTDYDVEWQDSSSTVPSVIQVDRGGTGATDAATARANLGAAASNHAHAASDITSGTLPVSRGGTGTTALTGGSGLIHNMFDNYLASPGYIAAFTDKWADGVFCTPLSLRSTMGLGNTTGALPVANGGTGATSIDAARRNLHISQGSKVCHGHGTAWVTLFESWNEFKSTTGCYDSDLPTLVTMNGDWGAFDGSLSDCEIHGGDAVYVMARTTDGPHTLYSSNKVRINWICIW